MSENLPAKINPNTEVIDAHVEVSIPDRVVTEHDAIVAMRRQGFIDINEHYLNDLESIGIFSRTGCLKIQRGRSMVHQRKLEMVVESLTEKLVTAQIKQGKKTTFKEGVLFLNPRDYAALGQTLAQLSAKLTDSQRFSVEMDQSYRSAASVKDEDQVQSSFTVGAPVRPQIVAQNVTINNPPQNPPAEKA